MERDAGAAGQASRDGIPRGEEFAFVTGLVVGVVMSVVDIAAFLLMFEDLLYGTVFTVALVGNPVAIVVLIICGAFTRRFRRHLVVVGAVLFTSPFVGIAVLSIVDGI